jgi:hypothetical protein
MLTVRRDGADHLWKRPGRPAQMSPGSPPPEIPPVFAAGAKDGEDADPAPTNAKKGRRPEKRHFTADPAETFHGSNDLAAKRPDPVT